MRGDEPRTTGRVRSVFPTYVGMNRAILCRGAPDETVFPTYVGMNHIDGVPAYIAENVFPTYVGMNRALPLCPPALSITGTLNQSTGPSQRSYARFTIRERMSQVIIKTVLLNELKNGCGLAP